MAEVQPVTEREIMLALRDRLQPKPEDPSYVVDEFYPGPIDTPQNAQSRQDLDDTAHWECPRCKRLDRTAREQRSNPQVPPRAPLVEKPPMSPLPSPEKIRPEALAAMRNSPPFNPSDWLRVQEHSWSTNLFDQPISFIELRWVGGEDQDNPLDKENMSPNNNDVEYLLPIMDLKETNDVDKTCTLQAL